MQERVRDVLGVASALYDSNPDWIVFFREVLGIEGIIRQVYRTPEDLAAFERTEEYAEIKQMLSELRRRAEAVAVLLAAELDGKVALLAAVSKDLVKHGIKAGDCVREAAKVVGGGGGGRPDLAEAGGKDASRIDEALAAGADVYRRALSALNVER